MIPVQEWSILDQTCCETMEVIGVCPPNELVLGPLHLTYPPGAGGSAAGSRGRPKIAAIRGRNRRGRGRNRRHHKISSADWAIGGRMATCRRFFGKS